MVIMKLGESQFNLALWCILLLFSLLAINVLLLLFLLFLLVVQGDSEGESFDVKLIRLSEHATK